MRRGRAPRYHLLMTACIAPDAEHAILERADPHVRLGDYEAALASWLAVDDPALASITFLENSGYPLDTLRALVDGQPRLRYPVRLAHTGGGYFPEGVGYGYAELGILDWAAEHCEAFATDDLIVKVTGRLQFPDLPRLVRRLPSGTSFACDAVNLHRPSARTGENGVLRTQLLVFRADFYRAHLLGLKSVMRPERGHRLIETVLYRTLWPLRANPAVLMRFPVNCSPVGRAAHWDKDYRSPRERARDAVRAVSRRVAPWLWI